MVDNRTAESRSALMSRIRSVDTAPEMTVRKLVRSMGYRYRLHDKSLPGKPDLVFRGERKAIFVHGCFWHAHGCKIGLPPKSHLEFWSEKLIRNRQRDGENVLALNTLGWQVLTIWQCETKDTQQLRRLLQDFLSRPQSAEAKTAKA